MQRDSKAIAHEARIARLRQSLLKRPQLDGMLVTKLQNIHYLSGFTGSAGYLLVTRTGAYFVSDFRYEEQAAAEVKGAVVIIEKRPPHKSLRSMMKKLSLRRIGVERTLECGFYDDAGGAKAGLVVTGGIVESLREIKDSHELSLIREAVRRAEIAFIRVKPHIKAGVTEASISRRLEAAMKAEGSRKLPFEIIVASGANSSRPHARASSKRLAEGDLVVIDWGAEAQGYFSDMTRTLLVRGQGIGQKKRIYNIVREANLKALKAVSAGMRLGELDAVAREHISRAGYGERFGHSLGHGVGMEVHESPRISAKSGGRVKNGMVITIEPGIYVPAMGGVRIEDMVSVGHGRLTSLPTSLEII